MRSHSPPDRNLTSLTAVDTFLSQGVVAKLQEWGVEHFNFPQQIWLYPHIAMGSQGTAPREVLAVNILTRLTQGRRVRALVGSPCARALELAPAFVEQCLPRADARWIHYRIPISVLRAWVALNRQVPTG